MTNLVRKRSMTNAFKQGSESDHTKTEAQDDRFNGSFVNSEMEQVSETRYAFKDSMGCWRTCDKAKVDAGGLWRARLMPIWWSPDRQTAYRDGHGRVYTREQLDASPGSLLTEYITCDLTTGEEMPC